MPGTLLGGASVGTVAGPSRRSDRWLNFRVAFPPEKDIRDREDSPGARNPYNLWPNGDCIGDETTGMAVTKTTVFDDDIRFGGTKAFSYSIKGQCTETVGGAPVPGATVELWLSNPDWDGANEPRLIGTTVTDAEGYYGFAVANNTKLHHIIAYVTGRGGVTARNLVGA